MNIILLNVIYRCEFSVKINKKDLQLLEGLSYL